MRDIVVTETLEDIDKDANGKINVDEYIGDMYGEGVEDHGGNIHRDQRILEETDQAFKNKKRMDGFDYTILANHVNVIKNGLEVINQRQKRRMEAFVKVHKRIKYT